MHYFFNKMYAYLNTSNMIRELVKTSFLLLLNANFYKPLFCHFLFFFLMDSTHKNKTNKKAVKPNKSLRIKWTENAIKALLFFLLENKERLEDLKYTCEAVSYPEGI